MTYSKFSLLLGIGLGLAVAWGALALTKDDIVFPVAELGNCQNEQECRTYCDDPANGAQCIVFAEKYSLLSESEIEKAKKFQDIGGVGPGGCTSEKACEAYCENVNNIEECLAFAEQNGFMEAGELEEARRVAQALRQGAQLPGGCTGKDSCEEYCSDSSHMKECVEFAEQAGFMSPEELKEAKQVLKALEAGVSFPGNCKGKNECEVYCEDPNNMEECVNFALAAGFIPPEEAEQVKKMLPLMKSGKMPGACREGKEECEAYCGQEENIEECTTFFTEAGFMTQEEAQMFRKTGGKGPGNCKGKEECEAFCNDSANQETCFAFAKEHGLISEEDLQRMEEGVVQLREGLEQAPPEVAQCLRERIGQDVVDKIQAGTFFPNPQLGEAMRECFELQQQVMENKMRECLAKSCDEFFACLDSLQQAGPQGEGRTEGDRPEEKEGGGFSAVQQEIKSKIGSCVQQFQPQEGQGFPGGEEFPGGFPGEPGFPQEFEGNSFPPEFQGKSREEIEQIFREQEGQRIRQEFEQEFDRQIQEQQNTQSFNFQDDSRAAACAQEGGVWDGAGCRAQERDQGTFPEGEPQHDESSQLQQEQIQRQDQQQQLEQQIQQQFEQLEQLQQLQQEQTPPPPAETGGSILDVASYFLRQLILGR